MQNAVERITLTRPEDRRSFTTLNIHARQFALAKEKDD
jgi:hypothetical protein